MWDHLSGTAIALSASVGVSDATTHADNQTGIAFYPIVSRSTTWSAKSHRPFQSVPCLPGNGPAMSLANQLSLNNATSLEGSETPSGVRAFCAQKQIKHEVDEAIGLVRIYFAMIGKPSFELVHDPDHDEDYLAVHVCVSGQPDLVVRQGRSFLRALRRSIDRDKLNFINVIYHAI